MKKRLSRKIRSTVPWLEHMAEANGIEEILPWRGSLVEFRARGDLCIRCRGTKLLCGKPSCPVLIKARIFSKKLRLIGGTEIEGSSPPGVFVGRVGYPRVYAGPLIPPVKGDTGLYDKPESWFGMSLDSIVGFRLSLVRGTFPVEVKKFQKAGKLMDQTLEIALAQSSVDSEASFKRSPKKVILLSDDVQPMGPSAPLTSLTTADARADQRLERAHEDWDLKAQKAVIGLFKGGLEVSRIQRAFSVGAFGVKWQRRLVPTRWSITAVDDLISVWLRDEFVKRNPLIDECRLYTLAAYGNRWVILMLPRAWSYESIEAWYPETTWNPHGKGIAMGGDHEDYRGRKSYAAIGGCYYAARLAVAERLAQEGRQATVVIFREVQRDQLMPLGVWLVRQSVRAALRKGYEKFSSLTEVLKATKSFLSIPLNFWEESSGILTDLRRKRTLDQYLS